MKYLFLLAGFFASSLAACAQDAQSSFAKDFTVEKINESTPVKNQAMTGTCWSFSTTALVESQLMKNKLGQFDLSEMFTVRNIYIEKARNYISRQGAAQFGEGSLGHDVIRAIHKYGAMPENVYSGLINGRNAHDHSVMARELKDYLDAVLRTKPVSAGWLAAYESILDKHMGRAPNSFIFQNRSHTPQSFATEILRFDERDYVNLTSFTHYPFYDQVVLDIPDNFSSGAYYNLPLNELMNTVKSALNAGYTIMWDADVSNDGFRQDRGLALYMGSQKQDDETFTPSATEGSWDAATRQRLFEELTTQDDHLMQLTGIVKSKDGKEFFTVKNSWGDVGPYKGYIAVSEAYFAINTISLVIPRAALNKLLLQRLKLN